MKSQRTVGSPCALGLALLLSTLSALPALAYAAPADDQTAAGAALPAVQPVAAPGDHSDTSGEIAQVTITAQRRATLLKDTPMSVQAITAKELDNDGIHSIDDLTRIMPGVEFNRSATSATGNYNDEDSEIAVRGIYSSAGASTTGVYIDDTPIQTRHLSFGSVAPFPAIFDLDRVEMLRGPQGTLFGAGSEGGAVRFIQPEPSLDEESLYLHSEVAATKNGAASYEAGAALGTVLVNDVMGLRLSVSTRHDGGYVDRVNVDPATGQSTGTVQSNANWEDTDTLRAALKVALSKDVNVIASVFHQELRLNDTSAYWESLSSPADGVLLNGNAQPDSSKDPFTLWSVKVNADFGTMKLTSSTSYFSRDQSGSSDYTQFLGTLLLGSPYPPVAGGDGTAVFTDVQRNVIEELKLQSTDPKAPLTWVAGLFLSRQNENTTELMQDLAVTNALGMQPFAGLQPGVLVYQGPYQAIDRQVALFGQTDLALTDTVKLTTGLRVANIRSSGQEYFVGPLVGPVASSIASSLNETPVTPKFGLSWQPDADDLFYVSAAKGYRVGGINPNLGNLCAQDLQTLGLSAAPETYKSDSLWSYEIGSKNSLLNRRLQLDSSAYYVDWKNIQQNVYLPDCGNEFAANMGSAVSKGADTAIRYKPFSSLLLTVDAAYTNARYSQTVVAGSNGAGAPIVTKGDFLSTTPWSLTLAVDYKIPGYDDLHPYLHTDYQLNTRQQGLTPGQDANNGGYDPAAINLPETKIMAMRAGALWNGWDVSLFVNNLFNSMPELVHQHDTTDSTLFFDRTWRPRTVGMTVNYRY